MHLYTYIYIKDQFFAACTLYIKPQMGCLLHACTIYGKLHCKVKAGGIQLPLGFKGLIEECGSKTQFFTCQLSAVPIHYILLQK
jgi:hypothetical protein